jgi:hypothetical protein
MKTSKAIPALDQLYRGFINHRDVMNSIGAPDQAKDMDDMANLCTRHITALLRAALKEATT